MHPQAHTLHLLPFATLISPPVPVPVAYMPFCLCCILAGAMHVHLLVDTFLSWTMPRTSSTFSCYRLQPLKHSLPCSGVTSILLFGCVLVPCICGSSHATRGPGLHTRQIPRFVPTTVQKRLPSLLPGRLPRPHYLQARALFAARFNLDTRAVVKHLPYYSTRA